MQLAVVALVVTGVPLLSPPSAQASTLPLVGTLPRFPADSVKAFGDIIKPTATGDWKDTVGGTLVSVLQRNELWQLYPTNTFGSESKPTVVAIRDATTLKITRTLTLPLQPSRSVASLPGGDWLHAFDSTKRIFFLSPFNRAGLPSWTMMEVNLETLAQRDWELGAPFVIAGRPTQGLRPAAMEYDRFSDSVVLMFGGISIGTSATKTLLHRINLKNPTALGETRLIRVCNGSATPIDQGRASQLAGIINQDFTYWTCQRAGSIGAVVKIRYSDMFKPESPEEIVAGPGFIDTSFADPHSGRIFLFTRASEVWAFDIHKMAFVGVVAGAGAGSTNPDSGYGFDATTGRIFIQSPSIGFGVAEGRFSPIPQARTYTSMKSLGQERIISDARTNRVFVLAGSLTARAGHYSIYDAGQAPVPPPPPDPDRNTADIDEQPGVTEARYFASGTGYGVRSLLAKGVVAVAPQPVLGQTSPTAAFFATQLTSKCGFTDRELVAGRVSTAEYDTGSTSAEAVGVDVDERTKLDVERLSRCDLVVPTAASVFSGLFSTVPAAVTHCDTAQGTVEKGRTCDSGTTWKTVSAECTSSTGGEGSSRSPSAGEAPSQGRVSCPEPGGDLTATGTGYLTGALQVGKAETTTNISPKGRGVQSTVTAVAQDIDLAGVVRIGEVVATAVSRSAGRPSDKPLSTYELVIKGMSLTVAGQTVALCDQYRQVAGDVQKLGNRSDLQGKNCDIEAAFGAVNTALGGRAEFRLSSGIDNELLKGTPRGALTAVQKSTARQASDQALVGDRATEVAGIEVMVFNDNLDYGRARQIYQFAGVATAATYNIALLPTGLGFDDDPASFDESDLSPAGDFGDAFLDGSGGMPSVFSPESGELAASSGDDDDNAGGFAGAVRALARGIRMFLTNPRHALLLLTAWALFSLPPVLARRRRLLALARSE